MVDTVITIIVILIVIYVLDRQYIGLLPSIVQPFQRLRRQSKLQLELETNPHNASTRAEIARILMDRKQYRQALEQLERILPIQSESAEVVYDLGFCYLKLSQLEKGEKMMLRAMELNPKVRYGEAYLRLAEQFSKVDAARSIEYLHKFKQIHSSSCEAYFRLGIVYEKLGKQREAKEAYNETLNIYRTLPKYKRKSERKWTLLAGLKR